MDLGTAGQWISALVALGALVISLWGSRSKRHDDALKTVKDGAADAIAAVSARVSTANNDIGRIFGALDANGQRLTKIENEMAHLPSKDITHRLETGMERLEGELKVLAEALKPVASISNRLQEFLLEQASRK